jgi:oligopeptide/dipeptide ABC transporter ATP-binding protein
MTEQGDASSPVVAMSGVDVRFGSRGQVAALKQVDLEVSRQTVLGVIGESGSGKTTLIRSMLGVVRPKAGTVNLNGHDLYSLSETQRFRVVAKEASLIFQDPRSSLNQRLSVGAIVGEPLKLHTSLSRAERRSKIGSLLESVGLDSALASRPTRRLSGGQLQRVALARALALDPPLIVADEPTSALDVSVQVQILKLLDGLREARSFAMVVVSHDMRVIQHLADEVAVMYAGRIVEYGPTAEVCGAGRHPYTQALLAAVPRLHAPIRTRDKQTEAPMPTVGCPYAHRCPRATSECAVDPVPVEGALTDHYTRCYHPVGTQEAVGSPL